jgi:8-oxo-dGTP pyrophosphatase MutT (NUDIX family)
LRLVKFDHTGHRIHVLWCPFPIPRGLTLGVRGLVRDEAGRIFLVKHRYEREWHLPGGGVKPGETLINALVRELKEEGNIELLEPPALHAIFFSTAASQRDRVAHVVAPVRLAGSVGEREGVSAAEHRRAGRPVPIARAVNSGSCLLLGGVIRRVPASSPNDGTISASE